MEKIPIKILRERYDRLGFFLFDERTPDAAKHVFSKLECVSLLEGILGGKWAVVVYIVQRLWRDVWQSACISLWFFWHQKVLRKSPEQIDKLLED